MTRRIAPFLAACALVQEADAKWGVAPEGWGDFRFALADDNTQQGIIADGMKSGADVYGRYRYLNGSVDTARNWYSYSGPEGAALVQFEKNSENIGVKGSYVIYMLQEDGGMEAFARHVEDPAFMKAYFWNLEWACKTLAGRNTVFVIEPDTWGYLLQHEQVRLGVTSPAEFGVQSAAREVRVNDIGYPHLEGLPNTVAGMMQGIVKTFRTFAPDARIGFHLNTWAWHPAVGGDSRGMAWWNQNLVDASADVNAHFLRNLFGGNSAVPGAGAAIDFGDFLVVEKYGLDAGYIQSLDAGTPTPMGSRYYWTDEGMGKWVGWCKRIGQTLDLPILGWQIPIGHMALPNTMNRWQDTFMAYFFAHPQEFIDAGFIGLWVGKGLTQGTDYSAVAGKGDDGKLFADLNAFDQKRPWIAPSISSVKPRSARPDRPQQALRRTHGSMAYRADGATPPHRGAATRARWRDAAGRILLSQGTQP